MLPQFIGSKSSTDKKVIFLLCLICLLARKKKMLVQTSSITAWTLSDALATLSAELPSTTAIWTLY